MFHASPRFTYYCCKPAEQANNNKNAEPRLLLVAFVTNCLLTFFFWVFRQNNWNCWRKTIPAHFPGLGETL
jgi:hypothetical protein